MKHLAYTRFNRSRQYISVIALPKMIQARFSLAVYSMTIPRQDLTGDEFTSWR